MRQKKITLQDLRNVLDYDAESGFFWWKMGKGRASEGRRAGTYISSDRRQITINGVSYLEHQLAWFHYYGAWAARVWHRSDDGWDNRIANLTDDPSEASNAKRIRKKTARGKKHISLSELNRALDYDPTTGVFRWRVQTGNRRPGSVAGSVHRFNGSTITLGGETYSQAQLAYFYMTGRWPAGRVSHRNRNASDNRWENLRARPQARVRRRTVDPLYAWLTAA